MAVVAFLSAKGAPGTTTTALLCAALWPRPVLLVDADTEGGDVALRLRREDGAPVDRSRGLLTLLALARRELSPSALPEHAQVLRGGTEVIAGLSGTEQAGAAGQLWSNLGHALATTPDRDVLVDCGRVRPGSAHLPLLQQADLLVCVLRPTVTGVVHTRERLAALKPLLVGPSGATPRIGVVVVAGSRERRDVSGAFALLERDLPGVELLGVLADDPEGARVFDGEQVVRPERTLLVRSGWPLTETLAAIVAPRSAVPPAEARPADAPPTDAASPDARPVDAPDADGSADPGRRPVDRRAPRGSRRRLRGRTPGTDDIQEQTA